MNSFMSQSSSVDLPYGGALNGHNGTVTPEQRLSIDQILQLMNSVATAVKGNDFSSQLAGNIYLLCQQLKNHGQTLEQNHKSELNRCFVALRQACCRDSGQLGTPCRLKMMELVELRAMGWRPNLAHTQYYLNRPEQPPSQSPITRPVTEPSQSTPVFTPSLSSHSTPFHQFSGLQTPQAAPPPPLFMSSQEMPPTSSAALGVPPGYFFIPSGAHGGWQNQMLHPAGGLLGTPSQQPLIDAATAAQWAATRNAAAAAAAAAALMGGSNMAKANAALGLKTPRLIGTVPLGLTPQNPKSNKATQLREEVTIRNCDSGKIMGVKGRRVAVVEELSKTVISFQKVDPKSKDRVLTITGSTEESIQFAKKLIEDTIRRNVSPNRFGEEQGTASTTPNSSSTSAAPSASVSAPAPAPAPARTRLGAPEPEEEEEEEEVGAGISIETAQDGTLKLCCDDPDVLLAAQAALSEYLNRARRSNRMSAEERAEKKERRKSMPLQSSQPKEETPPPTIKETRRAFTGSTPNLAASLAEGLSLQGGAKAKHFEGARPAAQYSRDALLQIRECADESQVPESVVRNGDAEVLAELQRSVPASERAPSTPANGTGTPSSGCTPVAAL